MSQHKSGSGWMFLLGYLGVVVAFLLLGVAPGWLAGVALALFVAVGVADHYRTEAHNREFVREQDERRAGEYATARASRVEQLAPYRERAEQLNDPFQREQMLDWCARREDGWHSRAEPYIENLDYRWWLALDAARFAQQLKQERTAKNQP